MQYLLLIYGNESYWSKLSEAEQKTIMQEYMDFSKSIAQSGHYKGGNELDRIATASTVRLRNGKRMTTDGPFAETKEQLGGYYLIEAKDQNEAEAIAERIPTARWGSIEVRPIIPHNLPG
ncbi:MAG TPA: YciI family protein [Terriglobales bacterium]|nr:YciI family protein [Terriglobales bacterium]